MDAPLKPRASEFPAPEPAQTALRRVGRSLWDAIVPGEGARSGPVPPLKLSERVSYGVGSIAFGIGGVSLLPNLLLLYFNQVIGLPAVWVGAAIMITTTIDAFTDPLIGAFSDRLRSPLGRRHTLMYLSAVPAALGFYLMWHAPAGLPPAALLAFTIAMLVFVNIAISLYEIPSMALAPELAPDYNLRTKLIAYRWLFLIIGSAAMNIVLFQVFLRQDEANPLGVLNRERYEEYGLVSAILIFAAILLSTAATHGRIKYLHAPRERGLSLRREWKQVKTALTHRSLLAIMLGGMMMGFGAGTTFGLQTYFSLHYWGLKPQEISYLILAYFVGSIVALWAGPLIGAKFGKKRSIIALYLLWLLTATGVISLRLLDLMPANGSPILLPILVCNLTFAIVFAVSCHIILGSAIADTIDDIAVKTGVRSEGMMFAGYGVLDKIANGGGAFVAGAILSAIAFPTGALPGSVEPGILRDMALAQLVIVVIFNLASIALLSRYSLTRADHERNAAILAQRRAGDDAAALESATPT